ncbi:MAG TPA: BlaI/MecI/CopY family transcriptional regulator [Bacteroidales bacterium]|nr:BlaI/MecI/CopY family transcriptional regulator [Bacteroidales bacterium]HOE04430.1 BlaI/MecI/CopY family transcriptional regulator [Bacteroidales bacterium]
MNQNQKELTKAELQIMQILWNIEKGFVNDILNEIPEPKPAYNTVSTIVRILEKKGFVSYIPYGKTHEYYPVVSKDQYTREYVGGVVKNYFHNSFKQMLSFFAENNKLSIHEIEEIRNLMEEELRKKQNK